MTKSILGIALVAFLIFGGIGACLGVSAYNEMSTAEVGLKAQWQENQNSYSKFTLEVSEMAGVTNAYADEFQENITALMEGRYSGGQGQLMSWIQEQNPTIDPQLYANIQTAISAGREDFRRSQTALLDRKRRYETSIVTFPGNAWAGVLGFPSEITGELKPPRDLDADGILTGLDYPVIKSGKTTKAFETGVDEGVNPFGG